MTTIKSQRWYRPREIAQLGLIQNSRGNNEESNYNFILNLIKSGRLRAKNYSTGKKLKYWLVPQSEINRYHDTITKVKP